MPLAAWVLLATFTWCSYAHAAHAAPVPPVAAALSSPSQGFGSNNSEDDSVAQPEKRLLKYFLPGSQAWMDDGGDLYPISQEGSKRAYSDRNFLRFGRSDVDKRNRNFLRFGRSGLGDYHNSDDETLNDSLVKRSRNFLRFGRPDMEDMFVVGGPMEFLNSLEGEVVKDDLPLEKQAAYRHGRSRNFLRFGRSVTRQLNAQSCDGCDGPKTQGNNPTPSSPTPVQPKASAKHDVAHKIESSEPRESTSQRMKRAADPTFNDYGSMSSYSPSSWARRFQPEEEIITVSSEDPQDVNKRALDRNFLRFGRDRNFLRFGRNRNFLRFGKRDRSNEYPPSSSSESSESLVVVSPAEYSRNVRAPQRNFLRFG
ncbi:FMRFamide-related neuropeptides [Procambarus clarkii]|uniref:FMRFamide-related neuropeptides n=1 Tax=Procambarus clarkii TaxID=6728 RepID=UPI0037422A2E